MKKVVALLLALLLLTPACLTALPAAKAAPTSEEPLSRTAEAVNHAEGLVWNKVVGTPSVATTEKGAVMTNLRNSWDSAGCDILPALRSVLGDRDVVTLRLTVEARATLKEGNQDHAVSVRPLLRGTNTLPGADDAGWNAAYAESLQGDSVFFFRSGGNIMATFDEGHMNLPHGVWVTFAAVLELTRNQINSNLLSEWVFCVDSIGGIDMIENIELKNLSVTETDSLAITQLGVDPTDDTTPLPRELTTEIWSPAEILLRSSVDYRNPYKDTEIDATFTHADGTTITLPGFWMAGKTWAVRFSPTKVGEWSYTVTCKDPDNAGLNATGKVTATEATKDTALAQHGFVTAVPGQHYYQYADGTPFFWLGDTNWQAFTNVSTTVCNYPGCDCGNQFKHIVDNRVDKGFTVYQTYFVPEGGNGEKPLWLDRAHERPDTAVFNDKVDEMFAYLHEQGLVVALGLGCHGSTMSRMDLEAFLRFTRYIVARYACYSVVWITGQEITELGNSITPGYTVFDCYIKGAELVEELDGYNHPNSAHMYPMHATDERAVRLDTSAWHDTWTVQGGHGQVQPKDFYQSYYEANGSGQVKPFIESEANYEDINCGPFTGYELNRYGAWASMLCGSAGFTYGVTGIWAGCFSTSAFTGWYGGLGSYSYEPWYIGLDKPGSYEVAYMKQFFEDIGPWYQLVPRFKDRTAAKLLGREDYLLSSTEDASLIVMYTYHTDSRLKSVITCLDSAKIYDAYWFDPRTGKYIPVDTAISAADGHYTMPDKPTEADWVFLLTSLGLAAHYEENRPTDLNPDYAQTTPTGTPVTPANVTAVGGITYSGADKANQTMTDHTLWLYDGDPATVWEPSANRTTQTFLFDLGTAEKLTHITITPAEGTVIPHFRVEGSNDGRIWTIITDTSLREAEFPGAGSEPLTGTYRYVKVLLLNAKNLNKAVSYETVFNSMNNATYSVTKIADITIYSNGEGAPTPEKLVAAPADQTPDGDTAVETDEATAPADTDKVSDDDTAASTTAAPQGEKPVKKGCSSAIGAGIAAVAIVAAAVAVLALRKREE